MADRCPGRHGFFPSIFAGLHCGMCIIEKPNDRSGREFENLCLVLFEHHFAAQDANFYGRNATGQNGIDIRLSSRQQATPETIIIQCKDVSELHWSTVKDDFEKAIRHFSGELADSAANLYFIVATTADGVNSPKLRAAADAFLSLNLAKDIRARFRYDFIAWPLLTEWVKNKQSLRDLFCRPTRPADVRITQAQLQLHRTLERCTHEMRLHEGRTALLDYMRSDSQADPEHYHWLPTKLFSSVLDLFMLSCDFERAKKLLDVILGSRPLEGRYLLQHLRAHRVLALCPRHNKHLPGLQGLVTRPAAPRALHREVESLAPQLFDALGDIDTQLCLALWMVSYAEDRRIVDGALRRALGLIAWAWPKDVPPLDPDRIYTVTANGHLYEEIVGGRRRVANNIQCLDFALVMAYSYIRSVHAIRFGIDATLAAESSQRGWPRHFNDLVSQHPLDLPGALKGGQHAFSHLPQFFAELKGRYYQPESTSAIYEKQVPELTASRYVCTAEFLLSDCSNGAVANRLAEFSKAGVFGYGARIVVSHCALERLAMAAWYQGAVLGDAMGAQITHLLSQVERLEVAGGGDSPIVSYPAYCDQADARCRSELDAAVALRDELGAGFLCTGVWDLKKAAHARHPVHAYWAPR